MEFPEKTPLKNSEVRYAYFCRKFCSKRVKNQGPRKLIQPWMRPVNKVNRGKFTFILLPKLRYPF